MKRVLLHCGEWSVEDLLLPNEPTVFLTATHENAVALRKSGMKERGGFLHRKYFTFENWMKSFSRRKAVDDIFQCFLLRNILQERGEKFYDAMLSPMVSFFHDLDCHGIRAEELCRCSDDYFQGLGEILALFHEKLKELNCSSGFNEEELSQMDIPKAQYVFEGFFTFTPLQMKLFACFPEECNVLVNLPYSLKQSTLLSHTVEQLRQAGFVVEEGQAKTYEEFLDGVELTSYEVPRFLPDIFYGEYKKLLQQQRATDICVYCGSEEERENILRRSVYEQIEWNCDKKNEAKIFREFLYLVLYLQEKSKKNLLYRLSLHYFPITEQREMLEGFLVQQDFQQAEEFYDFHQSVNLSEEELSVLVKFFQEVEREELPPQGEIADYVEYLSRYLQQAVEIIVQEDKLLQEDELYRQNREAVDFLQFHLEKLRQYETFYPTISREEFLSLLLLYLEQMNLSDRKNRRGSILTSLESGYLIESEIKLWYQFNGEYSSEKVSSYLYGKGHEEVLSQFGLIGDELEEDFLRLVVALKKCKRGIFLTDTTESGFAPIYYLLKKYLPLQEEKKEQRPVTSLYHQTGERAKKEKEEHLSAENVKQLNQRMTNHIFSATDLDTYIACPRFYLYSRIYHLEELAQGVKEELQKEEGIAYHKLLEEYYRNIYPQYSEEIVEHLVLQYFFPAHDREKLSFHEEITFFYYCYIVKTFLEKEAQMLQEHGISPRLQEQPFQFSLGELTVQGVIDRVDEVNGQEVITDYKRRSGATIQDVLAANSLQLPIYALSRQQEGKQVAALQYGELLKGKLKPVLVSQEVLPVGSKSAKVSAEEFQQILEMAKEKVLTCHEQMMRGEFPKAPLSEQRCENCIYQGVCGR